MKDVHNFGDYNFVAEVKQNEYKYIMMNDCILKVIGLPQLSIIL